MKIRSSTLVLMGLTTALGLRPLLLNAQEPLEFSVVVTGPTELVEKVGTVRRIGRDEIESRNARTLDEALRLVPGIYLRTAGDGTPRIDVRGFRSRHVLLLMNGVPINSTSDGQFDPARLSTQGIREIKVSYGSSSVLYGDNALGAVIEITTLDEKRDVSVDLSGGTPDQRGVGGRYARTADNWSFVASTSGYATNGYRLPDSFTPTSMEDGDRRENSDRRRGELRGALGYRFSPTALLSSEWSVGTGRYGIPTTIINDPTDIFAQPPRYERVDDYRAGTGQISFLIAPWQRLNLRAWVYRNQQREDRARYDDATYSSMDDPLVSGTFHSREQTRVTGSSALGRVDLQKWGSLRVALNQRRESFDSSGIIRDVPVSGTGGGGSGGGGGGGRGGGSVSTSPPTFAVRSFATDEHVDVYSTGVEWQAHPAPRVGTVLGTAFNMQQRPDAVSDTAPTWLVGVTYDPTSALQLHASATRKIRVPSIDQLFNTASGNPDLKSEHAYGVDAGGDYRLGMGSTVGISAFATNAYDFIEREQGQPFENHEQYRFRGGELTARTDVVPRLDLRAAYNFLDSENVAAPGTRALQTRPKHRSSLEWTWTPRPGSLVRGAAYYTGAQYLDSRGSDSIQTHVDGYGVVDIGFTQTLARRYDIAFDVTNLFDHLYEQAYGLPREGRAAVVTLRARMR